MRYFFEIYTIYITLILIIFVGSSVFQLLYFTEQTLRYRIVRLVPIPMLSFELWMFKKIRGSSGTNVTLRSSTGSWKRPPDIQFMIDRSQTKHFSMFLKAIQFQRNYGILCLSSSCIYNFARVTSPLSANIFWQNSFDHWLDQPSISSII